MLEKEIKKTISLLKINLILLVIDGKQSLTSEDIEIFKVARKSKKHAFDYQQNWGQKNKTTYSECCNLGFGLPIKVSTAHTGIENLKNLISEILPCNNSDKSLKKIQKLSIAIVETSWGKSTLLNSLKGENLSMTGALPNLTRDAVEAH